MGYLIEEYGQVLTAIGFSTCMIVAFTILLVSITV